MRFPLVLACCLAAALAAEETVKKDDVVKKTVEPKESTKSAEGDKKMPLKEDADEAPLLPEKTWGESVHKLTPTAEMFAANLPMYTKSKIKPEIAQAFNLMEELAHWNKEGNPNHLTFNGDDGEPAYAVMSSNQPVFLTSYANDVRFHLFTKYNESDIEGFQVTDFKQLEGAGFDATLPVKVVIHGFTNSIKSAAIQLVKNAFLEIGKFNVIGVDWGDLCRGPWYPGARVHVTGAGAKVGEFLDGLIELGLTEPSMLHLMGHSLGAHVAGIASKTMTKGKPARITGMDPAGPLFQLTNNNGILWRDDADLVDVIHTNAGFLGKSKHLGHVDFFPNGGHFQPGCPNDVTGACSHGRSVELFASTIRDKDAHLRAVLCPALPGHAGPCERTIRDGNPAATAEMGYYVQYDKEGAYFLKTSDKPNFKYVYAL